MDDASLYIVVAFSLDSAIKLNTDLTESKCGPLCAL